MSQSPLRDIRVISLNAENLFLYMDRYAGEDLSQMTEKQWQSLSSATVPNKSLEKTKWLAEGLLELDGDIIALAEVGGTESLSNFALYFLKNLYKPMIIEGNSDRGIDVGFLVKAELPYRYLLNSNKSRRLKVDLDQADNDKPLYFSRDLLELRVFREGEKKPEFILLTTHLKSKWDRVGDDPGGRKRRRLEANTLAEIVGELANETNNETPLIVCGDLNGCVRKDHLEAEFHELMNTTELRDIFDILEVPLSETATQVQFKHSHQRELVQIDHILVSKHLDDKLVAGACFVQRYKSEGKVLLPYPETLDQRSALPSDHFPVILTFKWPAP